MFDINIQLFGGGGSKSGFGGGGGEPSEPVGYAFLFTSDFGSKQKFKWIEGKTEKAAEDAAIKWGKENNMEPSTPITKEPMTREEARKFLEEKIKNRKKN